MGFQIGDQVGDYRVVGAIGAGGVGRVFRVEHAITGRVEAMKVLLESRAGSADAGERFQREIKLQAKLDHPGIASVHNAFWADEELVMIMELVEGTSLNQLIADGPAKIGPSLRFGMQCLESLSYAHKQGVTHRDVKPENIMVTTAGWVKLMDFGLAKEKQDAKLTQRGSAVGSAFYIAPEQARGSDSVDHRADIYSFGAVLYELITGLKPFTYKTTYDLLQASVSEQPLAPIQIRPDIPMGLNNAILRAMAKRREKRFQSAEEFRLALESIAANPNCVIDPPRQSTIEMAAVTTPAQRLQQLRRMLFVAAGLIAVFYLGITRLATTPQSAGGAMTSAEAAIAGPDLGGYVALQTVAIGDDASSVVLAPDASYVAIASGSVVQVVDTVSGEVRGTLTGLGESAADMKLSADGRLLAAIGRGSEAVVWDVVTQKLIRRLAHARKVTAVAFSADGRYVASGSADRTVRVWDLKNPGASRVFVGPDEGPTDLVFSPNTSLLVLASKDSPLRFLSVEQDATEELSGSVAGVEKIAFSPSGLEIVAYGSRDVGVWDVPSRKVRDQFETVGNIQSMQKSETIGWLSLGTNAADGSIAELHRALTGQLLATIPHATRVVDSSLAADGSHFTTVTEGGTLTIWKTTR